MYLRLRSKNFKQCTSCTNTHTHITEAKDKEKGLTFELKNWPKVGVEMQRSVPLWGSEERTVCEMTTWREKNTKLQFATAECCTSGGAPARCAFSKPFLYTGDNPSAPQSCATNILFISITLITAGRQWSDSEKRKEQREMQVSPRAFHMQRAVIYSHATLQRPQNDKSKGGREGRDFCADWQMIHCIHLLGCCGFIYNMMENSANPLFQWMTIIPGVSCEASSLEEE